MSLNCLYAEIYNSNSNVAVTLSLSMVAGWIFVKR